MHPNQENKIRKFNFLLLILGLYTIWFQVRKANVIMKLHVHTYTHCSTRTVQVNICQKHLFLHQLTQNMTKDCSLNYVFSTWKFQAKNMLRTCCTQIVLCFCFDIQNNLCTQHVLNMFSAFSQHVLSLQFSCTELVIQWTIFCHILG